MRRVIVGTGALLGAWIFSLASYSRLPNDVITRWNLEFEPAHRLNKDIGAVLIPSLLLLLPVLPGLLARIDPRRDSYERHRATYWLIWNVVMVMIAALQALTIALSLGWNVDPAAAFALVVGVMLLVTGNFLTRLRPNWFLGIRTPWTLSSDEVWRRTHRVGARGMMLGGLVLAVGGFFGSEALRSASWIVALVLAIIGPVVYSFLEWWRLERRSRAV